MALELQPGHFYEDRDGRTWCCFRVNPNAAEHAFADCILTEPYSLVRPRVEYFYKDGRYDKAGVREFCLVAEVEPKPST
jgi:hypothetical protein